MKSTVSELSLTEKWKLDFIKQWKLNLIKKLQNAEFFNETFPNWNVYETTNLVHDLPVNNSDEFIKQLYALPKDVLLPSFTELLKTYGDGDGYKEFFNELIEKLFQLPAEILHPLISIKAKEWMHHSNIAQELFINKLFQLPAEVLHPIITAEGEEWLLLSDWSPEVFINKLFELPREVLQPFITEKATKLLLGTSIVEAEKIFINKLFQLPAEALQPILTINVIELLKVSRDLDSQIFINKLLELPGTILQTILTEENLTLLLKEYAELPDATLELQLNKFSELYSSGINLAQIIKNFNFETRQDMKVLKLTPAAISLIDEPSSLHPTISKLLAKTYIHTKGEELEKKEFISKWVIGLKKIIDSNASLAMILEKTANAEGENFLMDIQLLPGSDARGSCSYGLEIRVATKNNINEVLSNFVHESTHKAIQIIYNNNMLPYSKDANFDDMEKAIDAELSHAQILRLQPTTTSTIFSWLDSIIGNYPKEKIAIELLPHFTGQITESILSNEAKDSVSYNFANIVWTYLHNQLQLGSELSNLPALSYYHNVEFSEEQIEVAKAAQTIIDSGKPYHEWLNCDAGKLAFKSLSWMEKNDYSNQLLGLPAQELSEILASHLIALIESWGEHKDILDYSFLSKLPSDVINPIIKTHANLLLESMGQNNWIIQDQLSKMSGEELSQVLKINTPKFLESCHGSYKAVITCTLLELPSSQLTPILATHGDQLLKISDGYYKNLLENKLIELNLNTNNNIVEEVHGFDNLHNAVDIATLGDNVPPYVLTGEFPW